MIPRNRRAEAGRIGRGVLVAAAAVAPLAFGASGGDRAGWATVAGVVAVLGALAVRRRYPWVAALSILVLSVVDWRLFGATLLLSYGAGRARHPGRGALAALAGALAVVVLAMLAVTNAGLYTALGWAACATLCGVSPALLGSSRRRHADLVRAGWDQAAQLEREQRIVAEQARLQERARIAQDMHDSLGHDLSLVALRGGALELAPGLAPEHRATVTDLRAGITAAAERLGEIIGVLQDETDVAPRTGVGEPIAALVERAARSGVPVVLAEAGDWADVEPMQHRAAYRIVQEALTNATKHAPGAPVEVHLDREGDHLAVRVRNTRAPAVPGSALPHSGGRGLTGLRERVRLSGGVLTAGAMRGGGFEVVAHIPVRRGPAPPPEGGGQPASVAAFHRARRSARRALVLAIALPVGLVSTLGGTLMAIYAHDSLTSRLRPDAFQALPLGAARDDIADLLPARQVPERRDDAGPTRPDGSACEYYRSSAGLLPARFDVYRLCFLDGLLVSKDAFPALPDDEEDPT